MSELMARISFVKYHGAGNDFVCIDDRELVFKPFETKGQIEKICQRHLGVGADGLILLRTDEEHQFRMVYYNADGAPSSFCGNGSRCFIHFAQRIGLVEKGEAFKFVAADGLHVGTLKSDHTVEVSMNVSAELKKLSRTEDFVDTGSPHVISWMEVLPKGEICTIARKVRNSPAFAKTGVNVNYVVEASGDELLIRTYERGVENETLACGTGITAAAISFAKRRELIGDIQVDVKALGGRLSVCFKRNEQGEIAGVKLIGPAVPVYSATIEMATPDQSAS